MSDENVVERMCDQDGKLSMVYQFFCPGCGYGHSFDTSPGRWTFVNNDYVKPTFTPSLRVLGRPGKKETLCHLFVTGGKIIYCSDSPHELAGKTVQMTLIKDW